MISIQVEECQGDQTEPDEEEVWFDLSFIFNQKNPGFWKLSVQQKWRQPTRVDLLQTGGLGLPFPENFDDNDNGDDNNKSRFIENTACSPFPRRVF